jgi:excisionase family DNA binding protein
MNEVSFETVQQAAKRLGVTDRTIQNWAKAGKLSGAYKVGRDWLIPANIDVNGNNIEGNRIHGIMPLMSSSFEPGHCYDFIQSIEDKDERNIAMSEFYYYTGNPENASRLARQYIESDNDFQRLSALLICAFSYISIGDMTKASNILGRLKSELKSSVESNDEVYRSTAAIIADSASILLHLNIDVASKSDMDVRHMNDGFKQFICYVKAHKAYLEGEYGYSLGIVDSGIALSDDLYPIPMIYSHLMAAIDLMNLDKYDKAKGYFRKAWDLAVQDDMIEGFGEHHGLLQGLIETELSNKYPEYYDRIIDITYRFSSGWRKVHNNVTGESVADNLTTTEFTIAMLACRGWQNQDIASYMCISLSTVKHHMSDIFSKLGIVKRNQLRDYMLK